MSLFLPYIYINIALYPYTSPISILMLPNVLISFLYLYQHYPHTPYLITSHLIFPAHFRVSRMQSPTRLAPNTGAPVDPATSSMYAPAWFPPILRPDSLTTSCSLVSPSRCSTRPRRRTNTKVTAWGDPGLLELGAHGARVALLHSFRV